MPFRRGRQSFPHSVNAVEQDFGVGIGLKRGPAFEFLAQLAVVVYLAAEGEDIAAIGETIG